MKKLAKRYITIKNTTACSVINTSCISETEIGLFAQKISQYLSNILPHALVFCALAFYLSQGVYAQTNNQVTYPVKLQVEHAAVSSSAPVQELKAPEPVIRPIEQASSLPPKTVEKKKAVTDKKQTANIKKEQKPKKIDSKQSKSDAGTATNTKKITKKENQKISTTKAKTVVSVAEKKNTEKQIQNINAPISNIPTQNTQEKSSIEATPLTQLTKSDALENDSATQAAVARILDEAPLEDDNSDGEEAETVTPSAKNAPPVSTTVSPVTVSGNKEGFVKDFEEYVERKLAPTLPGAALAIIADGKVKVLAGYGVKKYGGRDEVDTETLFRLASVSKTIGSSAAAKLVQDGFVTWNTTVTSVLPDVEFSNSRYGDQLTIRHILSQSTGLPTHTNDNYIEEGLSFNEVVRRLRYVNFICPPGKCYTYQNVAYSLISPIIYKKTGKTYEQYVAEKLFRPLGMRTASFGLDNLRASNNYTQPHTKTRGGWAVEVLNENYYRVNPAAGANASITDMSRWVLAHMGQYPEVLPPAMLRTLHEKITRNSYYGAHDGVTDIHYALGWRSFDYRGDKNFMHHGGSVLGFRSEVVFNAELKIGMVMLSNSNRLPGSVVFKFLDTYEDYKRGKRPAAEPLVPVKKAKQKK